MSLPLSPDTENDFYPIGWEKQPFRKKPFPDETYAGAIRDATNIAWNIAHGPDAISEGAGDAMELFEELRDVSMKFRTEHEDFPGKSQMRIVEFNKLWNGKVVTLLKWFKGEKG